MFWRILINSFTLPVEVDITQVLINRRKTVGEYYTAMGMNEPQLLAKTWMNFKDRVLSENNHSWKNVYDIYFIKLKNKQ